MGTRLFLETKFQASRETRPRTPQSDGPQVQISDTGTFGSSLFLPGTQDMYRYQVSENVVHVRGSTTSSSAPTTTRSTCATTRSPWG